MQSFWKNFKRLLGLDNKRGLELGIKITKLVIAFALAIGTVIIPFLKDNQNLPIGWESYKFYGWQLLIFATIWLSVILIVVQQKWKDVLVEIGKRPRIYILLLASFVIPLFLDLNLLQIKVWGNEFRFQGLIFMISLILVVFLLKFLFGKVEAIILTLGVIISGFAQASLAIKQGLEFTNGNWVELINLAENSNRIYGSFGQINFWSGSVIIAVAGLYALSFFVNKLKSKLALISLAVILSIPVLISGSAWAIFVLLIILLTLSAPLLAKFKLTGEIFAYSRIALFASPVVAAMIHSIRETDFVKEILRFIYRLNPESTHLGFRDVYVNFLEWSANHRFFVWDMYLFSFNAGGNSIFRLIFGNGWDIGGKYFLIHDLSHGGYIDRAHNIFLDIWFAGGLALTIVFVALLIYIYRHVTINPKLYPLIAMLDVAILRELLHTDSVHNRVVLAITVLITIVLLQESTKAEIQDSQ